MQVGQLDEKTILRHQDDRDVAERLWNVVLSPTSRALSHSFACYVETKRAAWRRSRREAAARRLRNRPPLSQRRCTNGFEFASSATVDELKAQFVQPSVLQVLQSADAGSTRRQLPSLAPRFGGLSANPGRSCLQDGICRPRERMPSDCDTARTPLMFAEPLTTQKLDAKPAGQLYDFRLVRERQLREQDAADVAAIETLPTTSSTLLIETVATEVEAPSAGHVGKRISIVETALTPAAGKPIRSTANEKSISTAQEGQVVAVETVASKLNDQRESDVELECKGECDLDLLLEEERPRSARGEGDETVAQPSNLQVLLPIDIAQS